MNLNRLYSIFGSNRLERKDVQTYSQSTDETVRNAIEQKTANSSFESDAMEGWEDFSYDTGAMSNLDKKFTPSSSVSFYKVLVGSAAGIGISALVYFAFFNQQETNIVLAENPVEETLTTLLEDQEITLEETDVVIPEPIEKMNVIPAANQFKPKEIIEEYKERIILQEDEPEMDIETIAPLAIIPVSPSPEIIRDHKFAKEIYLYSMKLVDYTKYRAKPAVKTRQMTLTGTPANREQEDSPDLEPVWKDVDVPYMEYINKTMRTFEQSRYKKSLARLETILATYPDDVNANFYAGICLYNLGEYETAIFNFNNCLNGRFSNFDEEALWMKAESYQAAEKTEKANVIYKEIIDAGGYYKKRAKEKIS